MYPLSIGLGGGRRRRKPGGGASVWRAPSAVANSDTKPFTPNVLKEQEKTSLFRLRPTRFALRLSPRTLGLLPCPHAVMRALLEMLSRTGQRRFGALAGDRSRARPVHMPSSWTGNGQLASPPPPAEEPETRRASPSVRAVVETFAQMGVKFATDQCNVFFRSKTWKRPRTEVDFFGSSCAIILLGASSPSTRKQACVSAPVKIGRAARKRARGTRRR